ncbi:Glutamate--tRNA ligase [Orchesella cincta]|uniref:Glutamate--tRNA ligase n=1 Tax=Orchesella cincta TaxID=48709 RepID=A0A1D2NAG5_ORCCI|nr:Glutamate--tRNA ligase [Orchesella cincta]
MRGNCGYSCTTPGILKLISVIVVFFSQGLIVWGYYNATYVKEGHEKACLLSQKSGAEIYCPIATGVMWSVVIGLIAFWASLIMYIIHLIVELNKTIFKLFDWIGHFVGGLMMMIAGIVSIIYSIQAVWALPCKGKSCDDYSICTETILLHRGRTATYQPLWVLIGGICAVCTGVVYIGVGIAIKKQPEE